MKKHLHSPAPHRALLCLALALTLLPALALAYPSQVRDMLKGAGQTFVVRAPGTIDDVTKKELEATAQATAAKTGAKVYFIIDNKTSPSEYDSLYTDLGLNGRDLVVASNGPGWSVQVGSLSAQQKQDILNRVGLSGGKPLDKMKAIASDVSTALAQVRTTGNAMSWNDFQHANQGKGWSGQQMSDAYARYKKTGVMPSTTSGTLATTQAAPLAGSTNSSSGYGGWVFLGLVVAIITGVVVFRRRKRDAALGADFKAALEGPTRILTDVYMGLDGMENHPEFPALMDKVSAVQGKVDAIKGQAPSREAIARLEALSADANGVRIAFDQARRTLK